MDVEFPNKLKPNHLKEHSKNDKDIMEYYSRVEELRNYKNVSDKKIILLFNSILKHHPEEWLLLFDLLDIANARLTTTKLNFQKERGLYRCT